MRTFGDLSHVTRPLRSGGTVLVLDTGALITPEGQAMLSARYSRSATGAQQLIADMFKRDAGKFLRDNYQVGYGHKSIGELGDTAIFIDGLSMLAAKAIQDFPLYRGQESSTRYIDFSKQPFFDPVYYATQDRRAAETLEGWREIYLNAFEAAIPHLVKKFPRGEGEDEKTYEKAIRARAFDITRSFLPAGAMTNVAWVGDLRHVNDHLLTLRNHPLGEVRDIAEVVEDALIERFPNSFSKSRREAIESYELEVSGRYGYFHDSQYPDFEVERDGMDLTMLREYRSALENRPPKGELPFAVRECGSVRFRFLLDFGSFRDLQRHRAVITRMPLLTSEHGFERWYLEELPETHLEQAEFKIERQLIRLHQLNLEPVDRQYYLPMGMRTSIRMTGDLRALVYLAELRATRFVHPTLRKRAVQIAETLLRRYSATGLKLHLDADPDRFDVKRGTHDIVQKV